MKDFSINVSKPFAEGLLSLYQRIASDLKGEFGSNAEREPLTTTILRLYDFRLVARITADGEYDGRVPTGPGCYAFVTNDVARYIGRTASSLSTRLSRYLRPCRNGDSTNFRMNQILLKDVRAGIDIEVWVVQPSPYMDPVTGHPSTRAAVLALEHLLLEQFEFRDNVQACKAKTLKIKRRYLMP